MNLEDFKKHIEAEKMERLSKPWYFRYPLNIKDFVWYQIFCAIPDWKDEVKYKYQTLVRGYSERDILGMNSFIINKLRRPIKEYVRFEAEEGMALPKEFETDPASWLFILEKIEYSFDSEWLEENDWDNRKTALMSPEQIDIHNKKVTEGFELFGRYLMDMWD